MKVTAILLWVLSASLTVADLQIHTTHTPGACRGPVYSSLRTAIDGKSFCSSFLRTTATRITTKPTVTAIVRTTAKEGTTTVTSTITRTSTTYTTTTPFTTVTSTSFSNAAISCASSSGYLSGSVAGHSVSNAQQDLDKRTQTKAPYTTPPALQGQPSASISSLCSCLHVNLRTRTARSTVGRTTSTVTKTIGGDQETRISTVKITTTVRVTSTKTANSQTITVTYIQPVPTTFNGLNWYAYPNNYDFTQTPDVNVTQFKNPNNAEAAGTVNNPVEVAPGFNAQCSLPGSNKQLNCVQITVVMQGYFYAPAAGTYILTTGGNDQYSVDNWVSLYTGNAGLDSFNNSNDDWIAIRENHSLVQQGGTSTYQFSQGELIPMTIIYMNGGYQGNFMFNVITPDGNVHTDTSNFWIPACSSGN